MHAEPWKIGQLLDTEKTIIERMIELKVVATPNYENPTHEARNELIDRIAYMQIIADRLKYMQNDIYKRFRKIASYLIIRLKILDAAMKRNGVL